jgi:hypothetical protein
MLPERELSKGTYKRLNKMLRDIKETAISEIGGRNGEKIYGQVDRALAMLDNLVCEIEMEDRGSKPTDGSN